MNIVYINFYFFNKKKFVFHVIFQNLNIYVHSTPQRVSFILTQHIDLSFILTQHIDRDNCVLSIVYIINSF